jgi:hypothetical protein
VRKAVGPGFEVFVDANQAFQLDEAIRRAPRAPERRVPTAVPPVPVPPPPAPRSEPAPITR